MVEVKLSQLQENMEIASKEMIPICQDTGMAVIFMEIGQDVHFEGINLEINGISAQSAKPVWSHKS